MFHNQNNDEEEDSKLHWLWSGWRLTDYEERCVWVEGIGVSGPAWNPKNGSFLQNVAVDRNIIEARVRRAVNEDRKQGNRVIGSYRDRLLASEKSAYSDKAGNSTDTKNINLGRIGKASRELINKK